MLELSVFLRLSNKQAHLQAIKFSGKESETKTRVFLLLEEWSDGQTGFTMTESAEELKSKLKDGNVVVTRVPGWFLLLLGYQCPLTRCRDTRVRFVLRAFLRRGMASFKSSCARAQCGTASPSVIASPTSTHS